MDVKKDYDRIFDINCKPNFVLTKLVLPYMIEKGKGSLIYTLSINTALFFASDESSYCSGSMLTVDGAQSCGINSRI
jgi:NAD(P)-dependent dehydrogenase (short-subunit alcohol dehydrogenase family)